MKNVIAGLLMLVSFGASANIGWTVNDAVKFERTAKVAAEYYLIGYWAANEGVCTTEKRSTQLAEEAFLQVKYSAEGDEPYFAVLHWALMDVGGCLKKENPSE